METHLQLLDARHELCHQCIGRRLANGHGNRDRHAALAGRAITRTDQRIDGLVHVGVRHDQHVVLGTAEALRALAVVGGTRIDVMRDRGGADEAHRRDVRIIEDAVDRFLVAVDDVEDAGGQPRLEEQFGQPHRAGRVTLGGLEDEGIAAGNRRCGLPQRDHGREVERRDARRDAQRLAHRIHVDAGAGAIGVVTLQQMRNAAGEFDDLDAALQVAQRVGNGLAMLHGD